MLLTLLGILEIEDHKQVYASYHLTYETEDHRKPIYVDVGDLSQWMSQQSKVGMFAPHSGVLLLDEGYSGMDLPLIGTRKSDVQQSSKQVAVPLRLPKNPSAMKSWKESEARSSWNVKKHSKTNLYVASQLASSLDTRTRNCLR